MKGISIHGIHTNSDNWMSSIALMPAFDQEIHEIISANKVLEFVSAGDPHGEGSRVEKFYKDCRDRIPNDLVVLAGDYAAEPSFDETQSVGKIETIVKPFASYGKPVLLLGGNYDCPGASAKAATALGFPFQSIGWANAEGAGNQTHIGGFRILGVEGTNPINGLFPGERSEGEIERALGNAIKASSDNLPERTILFSHVPPYGMRDALGLFGLPQSVWGKRVGSTAIRDFIGHYKPLISVSGHVHEGVGMSVMSWENNIPTTKLDISMENCPYSALSVMNPKKERISLCVNHGTLEYWNIFHFRVAFVKDLCLCEVFRERLTGNDPFAKLSERILGRRFRYTKRILAVEPQELDGIVD